MSVLTDFVARTIPGLPSRDEIVKLCDDHWAEYYKTTHRSISQYVYRPPGTSFPLAFIKFGYRVTVGEAHTQAYIFHSLKHDPAPPFKVPEVYDAWDENSKGFVVMEYVPGLAATEVDVPRIVDAVHWLLKLPSPGDGKLGPVGGGPMWHSLWLFEEGPTYESVQQMDFHINNLVNFQQLSVDLSSDPICFYYDDINITNFIVSGKDLYAVDFRDAGFAPASFMNYSLANPRPGSHKILEHIKFPTTQNLPGLKRAGYLFKISGQNRFGWNRPVNL